jgi:hypothetical protein
MNCLLHVPHQDFVVILESLYDLLKPYGLFFLGQYGGRDFEGIYPEDHYNPKRFFSFLTDSQIQRLVRVKFEIEHFESVQLGNDDELHFQCLFLRRE